MAKLQLWALAGVLVTVVGCRSNSDQVSARLPRPSFQGPAIATVQRPAPVIRQPEILRPAQVATGPRDWMPTVPSRGWKYIVIHHSATPAGGAARFNKMHQGKGWDELGYHFVIGNGTDTGDGQIEVGSRWRKQKHGAHTKTANNDYNDRGIGICLVGNFDIDRPTPAQMESVHRLVGYLMRTYHVSPSNLIGHGDAKATDCPGRYMNVAGVRTSAARLAGQSSMPAPVRTAAAGQLLQPAP